MIDLGELDLIDVRMLLCDADGNLFPSEEPAFVASAEVTNRFLEHFGVVRRYTPTELRRATTGKNFRMTAVDLLVEAGVPIAPQLAAQHAEAVVAHGESADGQRILTDEALQWWVRGRKSMSPHTSARCSGPTPMSLVR